MNTQAAPLKDMVVLDLTRFMSGPYATMMLADAGARVIKVEPVDGEETRRLDPVTTDFDGEDISGYFLRLNRRKESVCLDLRSPEGKDTFLQLVEHADVVIENFRPEVMNRLGLGSDVLLEANPRLVYCAISGFGHTEGPYKQWPAFNIVAESIAGVLSQQATDDQPPRIIGPALGDLFAAMHASNGILMALLRRMQTNEGSVVDISMYDSMVSFNEYSIGYASVTGENLTSGGQGFKPNMAPYGLFPASDGWVAIAVGPTHQWLKLCQCMEMPKLAKDIRLHTGSGREQHFHEVIEPAVETWLADQRKDDVAAMLATAGVPAAPVRKTTELFDCEQLAARDMWLDVSGPGGGKWKFPNNPIKMYPEFDVSEAATVAPDESRDNVFRDFGIVSIDGLRTRSG